MSEDMKELDMKELDEVAGGAGGGDCRYNKNTLRCHTVEGLPHGKELYMYATPDSSKRMYVKYRNGDSILIQELAVEGTYVLAYTYNPGKWGWVLRKYVF